MEKLTGIQDLALEEIRKRFTLEPVSLKFPFPERPLRTLGLVRTDGEVYSSEEFSRVLLLKIDLPAFFAVRSVFMRPRIELDLPAIDCEIVFMGKKRIFLVDINKTQADGLYDNPDLFDKLAEIKERYPGLVSKTKKPRRSIASVLSKGACLVKIEEDDDEQALLIFQEYLSTYLDMVEKASPLTKQGVTQAKAAFENYLGTLLDHDPGFQGYKVLFGKKGGEARALDLFFDL